MRLIKCSDYVLEESGLMEWMLLHNHKEVINYANFLKRPLELGMFIPCDLDGNVINRPTKECYENSTILEDAHQIVKQFHEAKDRVLFEGCEVELFQGVYIVYFNKTEIWTTNVYNTHSTIEDLTGLGLRLTPNAVKQIS